MNSFEGLKPLSLNCLPRFFILRYIFEFSICHFFPYKLVVQERKTTVIIFPPSMQLIVFLSKAHATNYYGKSLNTISVYILNSLNKSFVLFFLFWFCINTEIEKLEEVMLNCQQNATKAQMFWSKMLPPPLAPLNYLYHG